MTTYNLIQARIAARAFKLAETADLYGGKWRGGSL